MMAVITIPIPTKPESTFPVEGPFLLRAGKKRAVRVVWCGARGTDCRWGDQCPRAGLSSGGPCPWEVASIDTLPRGDHS